MERIKPYVRFLEWALNKKTKQQARISDCNVCYLSNKQMLQFYSPDTLHIAQTTTFCTHQPGASAAVFQQDSLARPPLTENTYCKEIKTNPRSQKIGLKAHIHPRCIVH